MLFHRSFNDISMSQLKLSGSNMESVQAKMKNVMVLGSKINQVRHKITEDRFPENWLNII